MELDPETRSRSLLPGSELRPLFIGSLGTLEDGNLWRPRWGVYFSSQRWYHAVSRRSKESFGSPQRLSVFARTAVLLS